jgi:hypothetical protein
LDKCENLVLQNKEKLKELLNFVVEHTEEVKIVVITKREDEVKGVKLMKKVPIHKLEPKAAAKLFK